MGKGISDLKDEWDERARRLGKTKRSVLFKRFPSCLNNQIHRKHRDFILGNLPDHMSSVLDVGCGYGRISREIRKRQPSSLITGIELSEEFSAAYKEEFGSCLNVSVQQFQSTEQYDVIIFVTILMYLGEDELVPTLEKFWSILSPGGVMICIEPAIEFLELWRKLTGRSFASPTGGDVHHFRKNSLTGLFSRLDNSKTTDEMSVTLLPGIGFSSLHHGVVIAKNA
jgi:SAM-dependent methyltransferase